MDAADVVYAFLIAWGIYALIKWADEVRRPCEHEWNCRHIDCGILSIRHAQGAMIECEKCGIQEDVHINGSGRLYRIVDLDDHASGYEFIKLKGQ